MTDSNAVTIGNAASSTVHQTPSPVKATQRIEQLRAELAALRDEAAWLETRIYETREAVDDLEIEISDLEERHEEIGEVVETMTEALDAAERLAEVTGELTT